MAHLAQILGYAVKEYDISKVKQETRGVGIEVYGIEYDMLKLLKNIFLLHNVATVMTF